jgi:hypothetical protein
MTRRAQPEAAIERAVLMTSRDGQGRAGQS